jgi:hypothetical protein
VVRRGRDPLQLGPLLARHLQRGSSDHRHAQHQPISPFQRRTTS